MSRLIVKNLPKQTTEKRLRNVFSEKGQVTDLQLKYTKDGVFRRFAFIGFKSEEEALAAKEHFNNTYLDTSKLQVEICASLGDSKKPRSWSKYSADSSVYQKIHGVEEDQKEDKKKEKKENKEKETFATKFLKDLEADEEFAEFVEVHRSKADKPVWSNDARVPVAADWVETDGNDDTVADAEGGEGVKKKKKKKKKDKKQEEVAKNTNKPSDSAYESEGDNDKPEPSANIPELKQDRPEKKPVDSTFSAFTVKVSGLPYKCKKKQIKDFFKPLKTASLRVPPKVKGIAYAAFKTERELKNALRKHKSFLAGHKLSITKYTSKDLPQKKWKEFEQDANPEETLADTGRIYARNLSYTVTETDIEELFKTYGPLAEVHLPICSFSRKPKGFAFITFMFPEHAIKAFTELDGTLFQGRLLHLIPSKPKPSEERGDESTETSSYKKKKEGEIKASSSSSHNWNTLFLGVNAVADIMAEKYHTSKAEVLGTETGDNVAVRLALGETQIVEETRQFLTQNGVELDTFSRPPKERSKTVILVKNLPAKTDPQELIDIFSRFGQLARVLLPPMGVTAIVEFYEPSEARAAYRKLAYSKFHSVPLYLEWAPVNVFSKPPPSKEEQEAKLKEKSKKEAENQDLEQIDEGNDQEEAEEEENPESETTVFVKNLNFDTNEDALIEHFKVCGRIFQASVARKKDSKHPGKLLSMGYGFVQFKHRKSAKVALKELQHSELDGHSLELKLSHRATEVKINKQKSKQDLGKPTTKVLVRNIPFEATKKDIKELFSVFGTLKDVRLPKKMDGSGQHRGFGFVDFLTKKDAKRAFASLCHSTHLYGRRLVLEWASADDTDVEVLRKKTAEHFLTGPSKKRLKKSEFQDSLDMPAGPDFDE